MAQNMNENKLTPILMKSEEEAFKRLSDRRHNNQECWQRRSCYNHVH